MIKKLYQAVGKRDSNFLCSMSCFFDQEQDQRKRSGVERSQNTQAQSKEFEQQSDSKNFSW